MDSNQLLTRDQFREGVFIRDGHKCVVCGNLADDAHHIIERRLFPDGGYYLDNGASLCAQHHIEAEQTTLSCDLLRIAAGIGKVVLPPHLYGDISYDKWGNPIMENGLRLKGELFEDESVQKILAQGGVLGQFTNRVKYPRTWHMPWSPGVTKDDRIISDLSGFENQEIVVTEKMDGENTTMYRDYIHARSLEHNPHPSRNWVKKLHSEIAHDIPENFRLCGENLYAKHSIKYDQLASYFQLFSVWQGLTCLSWDETIEWAGLLNLTLVPVIYRGFKWQMPEESWFNPQAPVGIEGYVIRVARSFSYREFPRVVAKYVRANHVQTHGHWMRKTVEANKLRQT
jgi:hypothetical protein